MDTLQSAPISTDAAAKTGHRLWILCLCLMTLLTLGTLAWTFSGMKNGGSIYSAETTHNFGAVHEGDLLRHTFTIRNLHPWPITVTNVGATCGCTTATIHPGSPARLLPLQSTQIDVTFDTSGDRGAVQESVIVAAGSHRYNLLYVKAAVGPRIKHRKEGV